MSLIVKPGESTEMKVLVIFGTRPEAIKMAPLVKQLHSSERINCVVCVTGQHREMLDQVLEIFAVKPDYDLNVMTPGQDLGDVTAKILRGVRDIIRETHPDLVLVHGDTTSAFAAGLAAFYEGVHVGHVEAGLRTYDLAAPFPEEFNRQVVGRISSLHFAPTEKSKENLVREGVPEEAIFVTGNTVVDALLWVLDQDQKIAHATDELVEVLRFDFSNAKYVLVTGHRRENFGEGFEHICQALKSLAEKYPDIHFVYPVHLNPAVRGAVYHSLGSVVNVHLIEPLSYVLFARLLSSCLLVLTDSGGIQEEAPSLGKPVLVMRDVTERPEAVAAGTVLLVGAKEEAIVREVSRLLNDREAYSSMSMAHNPYGDGAASSRIVSIIEKKLCKGPE